MVSFECADSSLAEECAFRRILAWHTTRYPRLAVQDLYKLVFQGALGSEHAAADDSQARVWLEREVEALAEGPESPVIEPLPANGQIVRVNLRPYLAQQGDLEALLDGFIRTAREYKGTEEQFRRYWRYAEQMAEEGILGLAVNELRRFFQDMEAQGLPAVHHSEAYRKAYQPAYRVLVPSILFGNNQE